MLALLFAGTVAAAPITPGEHLEWTVSWMGVDAGTASATTATGDLGLVFEARCMSLPWLNRLYPINDHLRSDWRPGVGSVRYSSRFREGRFQQDQTTQLDADPIVVTRSQASEGLWRASEHTYAGVPGVEDPVSAFYRMRAEAGPVGERVRYVVWTGRKAATLHVWTAAAERVDDRRALRVEVLAEHEGADLEPKMTVWVSDDADRVPLLAEVRTRAGPVRARLTRRVVE